MTVVFLVLGVAVITAVALLAVGRLGELPDAEPDRPTVLLPDERLVDSDDVDNVRFAVGVRGYRMDEVDDVLDRLAADLAERDAKIAVLEQRLGAGRPDRRGEREEADALDFAADDPDDPRNAPA